jgi:hypothetical protein
MEADGNDVPTVIAEERAGTAREAARADGRCLMIARWVTTKWSGHEDSCDRCDRVGWDDVHSPVSG